jgi:hypothetical protein
MWGVARESVSDCVQIGEASAYGGFHVGTFSELVPGFNQHYGRRFARVNSSSCLLQHLLELSRGGAGANQLVRGGVGGPGAQVEARPVG